MPNGLRLSLRPYAGIGIGLKREEVVPGLGQIPYWFGVQAYLNREAIRKAKAEHYEAERTRVINANVQQANTERMVTGEPSREDRIAMVRIEQVKKLVPVAVAVVVGLLLMGSKRRY